MMSALPKRIQSYRCPAITVTFDPGLCDHSAVCICDLPEVFDLGRDRWIRPERGTVEDVVRVVKSCPTGALQYVLPEESGSWAM